MHKDLQVIDMNTNWFLKQKRRILARLAFSRKFLWITFEWDHSKVVYDIDPFLFNKTLDVVLNGLVVCFDSFVVGLGYQRDTKP